MMPSRSEAVQQAAAPKPPKVRKVEERMPWPKDYFEPEPRHGCSAIVDLGNNVSAVNWRNVPKGTE